MPSDFVSYQPATAKRKTLADLLRQLEDGPRASRESYATSPMQGSRVPVAQQSDNEDPDERRRRMALEAVRRLQKREL